MKAMSHSTGTLTTEGYQGFSINQNLAGPLAGGLKSWVRNFFDSWQLSGIERLGENFVAASDAQYLPEEFNDLTNRDEFRQEVAGALGLYHSDLADDELEFLNAGQNTLVVPVKDMGTLMSIDPDDEELQCYLNEHGTDVLVVFTPGTNRVMRIFSSRLADDETRGPAVAALGYYLQGRLMAWKEMKVFEYTQDHCFNVIGLRWYLNKLYFADFRRDQACR